MYRYRSALFALIAGVSASFWAASAARHQAEIETQLTVARFGYDRIHSLDREIASTLDIVRSLAAFYDRPSNGSRRSARIAFFTTRG